MGGSLGAFIDGRMLIWQATESERQMALGGDELLPETRGSSTHAINIRVPREAVWPWLVQIGCGRAGWYSYDRLDNSGIPSATRIRSELQDIHVGDVLPSRPGRSDGFEVLQLEPPSLFLLGAYFQLPGLLGLPWDQSRPPSFLRSTWGFYLREEDDGTRLIVRARAVFEPRWVGLLVNSFLGPGHWIMQRRQLLNLKARAEGAHRVTDD